MNKKGFIYMIAVSILLVIIISVFLVQYSYGFQKKQEAYSLKLYAMNDFVKALNNDMQRAISISSYRAFIALEDFITGSGQFLDDIETDFSQALLNGTIQGEFIPLMTDASLNSYIERLTIISTTQGIEVGIEILGVELYHVNPWNVNVVVNTSIAVQDLAGSSAWFYEKQFETKIPILDLRDPLYGVFTDNKIANTIRPTPYNLELQDIDDLNDHLAQSYYIQSTHAPSFLQRFENDLTPSIHGIESVVSIQSISDQDIIVYPERVKIDYIYFNNIAGDKRCNFEDVDQDIYFIIPSNRLGLYGLNNTDHDVC